MDDIDKLQALLDGLIAGQRSPDDLHDWLAKRARSDAAAASTTGHVVEKPAPTGTAAAPVLKAFRAGTHRSVTPEETVARVRQFLPAMGTTRVANVTGLDSIGIPVVVVCRPNARSLAVSQGKGLTLAAAEASGLMESVETYHAERITLPLKLASFEELRTSHRLAEIDQLPSIVRSRFHRDLPLLWIEGYDLLQRESVWVPYELAHTNYSLPLPPGSGCFLPSSNGLASGNHLLEAISHGICEIIERDASTLWSLADENVRRRARVDPTTIDDPDCRALLERFDRAGVAVGIWDTTSDVGVAAFYCMIIERNEDRLRPLLSAAGMGCHPTRPIALARALTEAAQSRLTAISGSRDDVIRDQYERSQNLDTLRRLRADLHKPGPMRRFTEAPSRDGETLNDDVDWELERLRSIGITRVIVIDLTRPEFGFPVVRVIIPGLEASALIPGYSPGARARAVMGASA